MAGTRRIELALRALTALSVVVAATALLWPASLPEAEIAPAGLEPGARAPIRPPPGDAVSREIIGGNIFSTTRRPPATRYRPIGPAEGESLAEGGTESGEGAPRLYGIVPAANGAAALLRLDRAVGGARLYREGERGGSYRVESIGERSVVLSGPAGRVELRLPAAPETAR